MRLLYPPDTAKITRRKTGVICKSSIVPRVGSRFVPRRPPARAGRDLDGTTARGRRTLKSWVLVNVTFQLYRAARYRAPGPRDDRRIVGRPAQGVHRWSAEPGTAHRRPGARGASRSVRGRRNRHGNPQHIMVHATSSLYFRSTSPGGTLSHID